MKLYNGVNIPEVGFGMWLVEKKDAKRCVVDAIDVGYTHIDTAQGYGNEKEVGEGIKASKKKREEIFVTSKVIAEYKYYEDAKKSIQESLDRMEFDYIDLMLIHCPQPWSEYGKNPYRYEKENLEVWRAMEEFYKAGKLKAIGVSNFNESDIENLIKNAEIKPMVNQIPVHIGNVNKPLIDYCKEHDIVVEAYCPNAHGRLINNPDILRVASKYNVNVGSLCVKYTIDLGCVSLPKTLSKAHMIDNISLDFEIKKEDKEFLDSLKNL